MYKNCHILLHGLCFFPFDIVSCCYAPNDHINGCKPPVLFENYHGELFSKEELFSKIRKYSDFFKQGNCPKECEGCFQIKEADRDEGEYIDFMTITQFSKCNADCIYCSNNLNPTERTHETYDIVPLLHHFKQLGIIKDNCELHIGGGEFTIYKECEQIIEEFGFDNYKIYIPTNAIHYSEKIHNAMQHGSTFIIVSLDSGCRKTYKKIKRVDTFDKVVKNLYKYKDNIKTKITLKYIIIPGINDNLKEYKKFLKIAKELGAIVRIDIDARYLRKEKNIINPLYISLAKKMYKITERIGIDVEFYSFLQQGIHQSTNRKYTIKDIWNYIELKYLKKYEKTLYTDYKYDK